MKAILFSIVMYSCIWATGGKVDVKLDITHNVVPSRNLPTYKVKINNDQTTEIINNSDKISLGIYDVEISQLGYKKQIIRNKKAVEGKFFIVKLQLIAKKRAIFSEVHMHNMIEIHKLIDVKTKKTVGFHDTFYPGKELHFRIEFRRYKIIEVKKILPVGEGPYIIVPDEKKEQPLVPLEVIIMNKKMTVDQIQYIPIFKLDNTEIKSHHLKVEKGIACSFYTLWVDPKKKNLRAYIGYLIIERDLNQYPRYIVFIHKPTNVSITRLIQHLQTVYKRKNSTTDVINAIDNLLLKDENLQILQRCSKKEIIALLSYLDQFAGKEIQQIKAKLSKEL